MDKVKCYFCGCPLKVPIVDELSAKRITKDIPISHKELMRSDYKYVCHDCTKTDKNWKWMLTPDSNGHAALSHKANIVVSENSDQINDVKNTIMRDLTTLHDLLLQNIMSTLEEKQINNSIEQLKFSLDRL